MRQNLLNPDFVYEYIKSLSHANGYLVLHFNLVQLRFQCPPPYLETDSMYNYCYEAVIYRPKKKLSLEGITLVDDGNNQYRWSVSSKDFYCFCEFKVIYLDIFCGRFHIEDITIKDPDKYPSYDNLFFGKKDKSCYGVHYAEKLL